MRSIVKQNNGWKSKARPERGFQHPDFSDEHWESTRLPHTNLELPLDNFDPASFRFITGYRSHLTFEAPAQHRVFLVFEAVMARAEVWIDGQQQVEHLGGYTPFEVEFPAATVARGSALVAVVADADENPGIPPFGGAVDYLTYGGIYREVRLEIRPPRFIETLTLATPAGLGHPMVKGEVILDGPWTGEIPLVGSVRVIDHETGEERAHGAIGWAPGCREAPYELEVAGAGLWDLDSPRLYELRVETDADVVSRTFGFRQAEFTPQGFRLNGRLVKLRGLNRHQSWPVVGYAMPARAQAADADLLKFDLGCTMVRSSHYPASPAFLDRCDEIGLLVFEEIPGWQHVGDRSWKNVVLQNVAEMIVRDRHRPAVVLWGVRINESPDDDELYRATNDLAHRLDPSRATGGVRNFAGSHRFEDVYTFNDFSHDGVAQPLLPKRAVTKEKVPYLVTEHTGHMFPTKKSDPEARRVEHALRHARIQNAAAAAPGTSGALGWCLADYATHGDFGSGDQICHHGVVDMFRCFKPAAAFYASQRPGPAFGQVASRLAVGEHDAGSLPSLWVFTNSAEVRVYQGDRFVGTFWPRRKQFPALPHPPVLIDDLIGSALEDEPELSRAQAATVKRFLLAFHRRGGMPSWRYQVPMGILMARKGWSRDRVAELYSKYITGWGSAALEYQFEGWTGGVREWVQTLGPTHASRLELIVDTPRLVEGDTWDVLRAEVKLLDTHGNEVWYGATPVTLEVDGPLRILGPATRPLQGGSTAFWLATTGEVGPARVQARIDRFESAALAVQISR